MNTCPSCKMQNTMSPYEERLMMRGVEVLAHGTKCANCGEVLIPMEDLQRQEKQAAAKIVEIGIRDGKEFQFVRKIAELKGTEVAELLGVRAETVSRWERGEQPVPRAAAFTLGELYAHPRTARAKLEQLIAI